MGSETVEIDNLNVYNNPILPREELRKKITKQNHGICISGSETYFMVPKGSGHRSLENSDIEIVETCWINLYVFENGYFNFQLILNKEIIKDISWGPLI